MATTKKQVMDVSKPGKTPAPATARPVIVGHGAMLKDPMVTLPGSEAATEVATVDTDKPLQAPSKSKLVVAPIKEEAKPAKHSGKQADGDKQAEKGSGPVLELVPAKADNDTSDTPNSEDQPAPEQKSKDSDAEGKKSDANIDASEEAIVSAVADQAAIDRKQKKDLEEADERQKALDALIDEKTYFVPIGQVRHRRNNHLLIAGAVSLFIIVAAAVGAVRADIISLPNINLPSLPFLSKNSTPADSAVAVPTSTGVVVPNRLYYKKAASGSYTLTLTDASNKVLQEASSPKIPVSKVVLSDGSMVVAYARETAASGRTDDYYRIAADGYKQLSDDAQNAMGSILFAGSGTNVVSFRCADECKTASDLLVANIDVAKGTVTTVNLDALKQKYASFSLANVSQDKKGIVYIADTATDLTTFNTAVSAKLQSQSGAVSQEAYVNAAKGILWRRYVVITGLDGAVKQTYPIDVDYTYYGRYWVSPSGASVVYSNNGEPGKLLVVNATKNTKALAAYDPAYSTESFGGTTVAQNPLWSPDGSKLLFTGRHTGTGTEQLAYLQVANNSVAVISNGTIRNEQFINPLWANNDVVRYAVTNGDAVVRNEQYALTTKKSTSLGTDFGTFVGISDGNR